jgi:hypothetical protein
MLSKDCDGCSKLKECSRYQEPSKVRVYCPDGIVHLIDSASMNQNPEVVCFIRDL